MSFGGGSIIAVISIVISNIIHWPVVFAVYFGIQSVYLFDRLSGLSVDLSNRQRISHFSKNQTSYRWLIWINLLVCFGIFYVYSWKSLFWGLIIFGSGFIYTAFLKNLTTKIPIFKNLFVPIPYSLLPFLLASYLSLSLDTAILLLAIFIFARLFIAVAFYDVKDIDDDRTHKIRTLAVLLPPKRLDLLLSVLNICSAIPILAGVLLRVFPIYSLILLSVIPYFSLYRFYSKKTKDISYFSYLFCDGEYILWLPLILLARGIWLLLIS